MALAGIAGSLALIAGWQAALRYAPLPPGVWVNTQRP
ncbi:MAG: hypothetical protein ACJAQU_000027 [Loktanella salsilacus]|jgi:hypothetical protein